MSDTLFSELEPSANEMKAQTLKELIELFENQTRLLKKEIEANAFAISQIKKILESEGA
ncbi:hypothetical protein [Campylobacter sp.]|uniref:hypothetical protein n=1 Tax=Campylobacter sp. TaxID=205 RepID=UPI002A75D07D|nr:hypothetical protein [Campylobacter sp.]MDY3246359.1 hypothetical protein [Campylobacter sp.]MDY4803776.1 hypothetical protein [Campylobacter sp.]